MGNGLRDWLIQRFSAVFLAAYTLFLVFFVLTHPELTHEQWQWLFSNMVMQVSTVIALIMVALHAWVGLWTVLTDYVKPIFLRYFLQGLILLILLGYVIWGILILWGT